MKSREEKQIRDYLLGLLPEEHGEKLEERVLRDDDFAEWLTLVEDELIEDFARGALDTRERERFKSHFLSTPRRRRKLMLVRGLRKYSTEMAPAGVLDQPRRTSWLDSILLYPWRTAAVTAMAVIAAVIVWNLTHRNSDVDKGLLALNEAYKSYRPVEARVTGLSYATLNVTRGPDSNSSRELDRSAALLQNAVAEDASPEALHALGRLYLLQKNFDKAIVQLQEALKKAPDDSRIHSDLGAALLEKGKLERLNDQSGHSETTLAQSLEHLKRAVELNNSLLDAHFNLALLYEEMKLLPQALEEWEKYVSLDSSSPWAGEARRKIEEIRKRNERVTKRDEDLFNEFTTARKAGDQEKVWRVFSKAQLRTGNLIANRLVDDYLAASTSGRSEEAKDLLQSLTDLAALSTDKNKEQFTADLVHVYRSASPHQLEILRQARRDLTDAHALFNQTKHDAAIELYSRAAALFEQVGDRPETLSARFWIGFCYSWRGDEPQQTLTVFSDVQEQCKKHNYKWLQSMIDSGLVSVHIRATQYSLAAERGWDAYKMSEQIGDENGVLRILSNLSSLYRDMGNYSQSLYLVRKGLDLGIEIAANDSQMIGLYATSAGSLNALGHHLAAIEYEKQALRLADNPLTRSRYLVQMGLIQGNSKNYDEAIKSIRSGIEVGGSVGNEKIRLEMNAYGRLFLGRAYRESEQFDEALAALNEVMDFSQQNNKQFWLLHEARKEQLLTRIAQGEIAAAGQELARVLDDYEKQRNEILEDTNRTKYFAKEQGIYDIAIDFAHSHLADERQAFNYSERSRARSLLDTTTADWRVVEEDNSPQVRFSSASLPPMPVEAVQESLPDQVQLLQFAVLKEKLIIWYLTHDRFETETVKVDSDRLVEKVDRLLTLVSRPVPGDGRQLLNVATELYDLLIGPVVQLLNRERQLCIIPDKVLNLLPFNILFSSSAQKYLIEDFTLSYASSANVFVHDTTLAHEKGSSNESLLGVGNPNFDRNAFPAFDNLPSAAVEIAEIGKLYELHQPASLLTRSEPTKSRVLEGMRKADVLHLATHYLPDATSPMRSKLLLATDRERSDTANSVLQVYEIYRLNPLKAKLAVLAGCRTGVEDYIDGEGAIGLARPFKAAGVPVVIASLWAVDSQATTDLMINFHRLRTRERLSSAAALRAAQLTMLKHSNPSYREPYYWASFSLSGGYSDY